MGGGIYSSAEAPGTKVNGLPVLLMQNGEIAEEAIASGEQFPAAEFRSKSPDKSDGAVLVTAFTPDQIREMGLYINLPFDQMQGQTSVKLAPIVEDGNLLLRAESPEDLTKADQWLRSRFDDEGYLLGNDGEFHIRLLPPLKAYRDRLQVWRPQPEGEGWYSYQATDILMEVDHGNDPTADATSKVEKSLPVTSSPALRFPTASDCFSLPEPQRQSAAAEIFSPLQFPPEGLDDDYKKYCSAVLTRINMYKDDSGRILARLGE